MTISTLALVVGMTLVVVALGAFIAGLAMKLGHRHEERLFTVLADIRLHAAQTELRERQIKNQIDENVRLVEQLEQGPTVRHSRKPTSQ